MYPNSQSSASGRPLSSPPGAKPPKRVPFKPKPPRRPSPGSYPGKPGPKAPAQPKFNPRALPMIARPDFRTGPLGGAFALGFHIGLWMFRPGQPGSEPEVAPPGGVPYVPNPLNWIYWAFGDQTLDPPFLPNYMAESSLIVVPGGMPWIDPDVPPYYYNAQSSFVGEYAGEDTLGFWQGYVLGENQYHLHRASYKHIQGAVEPRPKWIPAGDPIPGTGGDPGPGKVWVAPRSPWAPKPSIWPAFNPGLLPVVEPSPSPGYSPKPIARPYPMPEPWSPQAPDVGPVPGGNPWTNPQPGVNPGTQPGVNPTPNPLPGGNPGVQPVPEGLPEAFPEFTFAPVPIPGELTFTRGLPRNNPRANHRPQRPGPRTKETKVRMHPILRFLWNSFSPITETVDLIEVLYECQPKATKVREYKNRGRQPNPFEKASIVYRDINTMDVGCAVTGYIENQIEDMMYSIGGKQLADANRKLNRPIGFEAGGGLSGYRPHVTISGLS